MVVIAKRENYRHLHTVVPPDATLLVQEALSTPSVIACLRVLLGRWGVVLALSLLFITGSVLTQLSSL